MTDRDRGGYDPVPHSHVVPTGYLKAWSHGKQIAMPACERFCLSVGWATGRRSSQELLSTCPAGNRRDHLRHRVVAPTGRDGSVADHSRPRGGDGHSISTTRARSASSSPSSIYVVPHFGSGTRDRLPQCSTRCMRIRLGP